MSAGKSPTAAAASALSGDEPGSARFSTASARRLPRAAAATSTRAAICPNAHKMAGHEPPTSSEAVKVVLRGIRRTIGSAKQGKAPATADLIGQMVALCADNMIGKRTARCSAWVCGAFRRSELCALEVAGLTEVPDGLRVLIRRSKGDQEGKGVEVAILRGCRLRPVEAVESWLAAGEISTGPVFRPVLKGQRVQAVALTPHSAAQIVKAYAKRAGLDAQGFAGHSCVATCDAPTCSRNTPGRRSCNSW